MIESVGLIYACMVIVVWIVMLRALMVEIVVNVNFIELHHGYVLKLVNYILEYVRTC